MMNTIKKNKFSLAIIIIFAIVCALYLSRLKPGIQGDGKEYIMQTVAFQNHFSFGVTEADLKEAMEEFHNEAEYLEAEYYNDHHMHESGNARYSNHYGSYSALVVPVKLILSILNIYPLRAFSLTNYLLIITAALVILFCLKCGEKKKFFLIVLTLNNPAIFYIPWTHSEIYLYAFTVMGLVFFYNKQYGRSILFLSIAAMQNLGIIPFAAMVGIDYIFECYINYKELTGTKNLVGFVKAYYKKIVPYGLLYLPAFLPIISTYIKFGTYNLVADVAMEDKYLLHKALDYVFDLNLGIFPYEPIITISFIVMAIIGIRKCRRNTIINVIGIVGMLYIIAHQVQINCGMQQMMRYNVWILPMLLFFVIMNCGNKGKSLYVLGIGEAFVTGGIIAYIVILGGDFTCNQFAPWTKVIMNTVPGLYNPSHGIFYSRALGVETYHREDPVCYVNDEGSIKKILLSKKAEEVFYTDDWKLYDAYGNEIDKTTLKTVTVDSGDYKYINFTEEVYRINSYELGNTIYFYSGQYNADKYVQTGLSYREEWGSWTEGECLVLYMGINDETPIISGYIDVATTFFQPQNVSILINDHLVYDAVIDGDQDISFTFDNPHTNIIKMTMLLPDSVSPSDVQVSSDERVLGIGLLTIEFYEETYNSQ